MASETKKPSLARLVQQIGEIVAQGEDSGSQSQASDGGLRVRLRTVLLSLLDGIIGNTGQSKEVASMLKLLAITLSRSSTLVSGDGHSILPEVLERLLPLLVRIDLASMHQEITNLICKILGLIHGTTPSLLVSLAHDINLLLADVCEVAAVISQQPELIASVSCFAGALRGTDSAAPPLELRLEGSDACCSLLRSLLRMLAHCLELRPLSLGSTATPPLLHHCHTLLLSSRLGLQAATMQLLRAAVVSMPLAPCTFSLLLDSLGLVMQSLSSTLAVGKPAGLHPQRQLLSSSTPPGQLTPQVVEQQEWWERLLGLLHILLDRATECPTAAPLLLPRIHNLAVAAASRPGLPDRMQLQWCQLVHSTLLTEPLLLECSCPQLLALFPPASPACRQLILQCLVVYLHCQQRVCGAEAVAAAFAKAAQGGGFLAEAAAAPCEEEADQEAQEGRSARKRRRVRITPLRPASRQQEATEEGEQSRHLQQPGLGLQEVAVAVCRLAVELQKRCCLQQPGIECAIALASLLPLLVPQQATALGLSVLPAVLQPPSDSRRRQSLGSDSERLSALLRLTLATLQAGLVEAATGAVTAGVALSLVPAPHLLALLQRCWDEEIWAPGAHGAAVAAEHKVLALGAAVAGMHAELLDSADVLELFNKSLELSGNTGVAVTDAAASPAAIAAALLLPVVCCIGGGREHLLGSQSRATQGGRRQKHNPHHQNPLVTALQQLLSRNQQPAVAGAIARGLCCVLSHPQAPGQLALAAIESAARLSAGSNPGSGSSAGFGNCHSLQHMGGLAAEAPDFQTSLTAAVSEWMRLALEKLVAAGLPTEGQVALVEAVAGFLRRGTPGQLEHSRLLVQWLLRQAASLQAAVREAVLRQAALFAEPQVVLAMCHEGEHPIHTKEREARLESYEAQMLQALREELEAASAPGSRAASGSTGESIREGLVQIIGCVGCRMRSHPAHQLLLGIMITQLDHREARLRAMAAEALLGFAEQHKVPLRDIVFGSPKLVAFLARRLPDRPELSAELAELLECSLRTLTLAIVPQALPILVAENNRQGLELLAQQAGMDVHKLVHDHGHCVVARELFQGSTSFDAYISVLESVTGQDFVLFLYQTMSRTILEIMSEAGSAEDWGSGVALPDTVLRRAIVTFENLSHVVKGDQQELSLADFLADGDHVTRMLKEWGDSLEKRLPQQQQQQLLAAAARPGGRDPAGSEGCAAQPQMSPADTLACVVVLRCVLLLCKLVGRFIGRFLPQLLVLLAAGLRPCNPQAVRLQCLESWLGLVRALAAEAPMQLGGIVNQVVVSLLEPLQEGGDRTVAVAATRVLQELVVICRRSHKDKLRAVPPLPNWLPELQALNESLARERGKLESADQLELLIQSLGDESMTVRATALRELRTVLSSRREWALGLLAECGGAINSGAACGGSEGTGVASGDTGALLPRLMSALLRCCDPEINNMVSQQAQQDCAECLGMLGAVDPSRLHINLQSPAPRCASDGELLVCLISRHLVRLLKTAPSLQVLDAATLAIQELLRHYSQAEGLEPAVVNLTGTDQGQQRSRETTPAAAEGNLLFAALAQEVQAIVRPYLDSKYQIRGAVQRPLGTLFGSQAGMSFRKWLFMWLSQLVHHHASGQQLKLFQSLIPVFRHDIPTSLFLMPYLVHNVLAHGSDGARQGVQLEIQAVLAGASGSREGTLCCQAVFTLLDTLQKWHGEAKAAAQKESQTAGQQETGRSDDSGQHVSLGPQWDCIHQLLEAMPKRMLARAASQCGAHARSLQYFETHVRSLHNGGLNPAALRSATYDDEEVSYLQEVYGKLEEPDGLQGLVRLRQGGPRPEDQRLAAEKAGNWSEALTLYEQALQHSGSGVPGSAGIGSSGIKAAGGAEVARGAAAVLAAAGKGGDGAAAAATAGSAGAGLSALQRGYLESLLHIGHLKGLLTQVEGLAAGSGSMAAAQLAALGAAAAWRLGQWELVEGYTEAASEGFKSLDTDARWEVRIAGLLWSVAGGDMRTLRLNLEQARSEVMGPFSAAAMESYSRAYPHLVKLHMLQEIADAAGALQRGEGAAERRRSLRWDERLRVTQSSLASQEPILALRRQLASLLGAEAEAGECWLQLARLCRGTGHYEAATTAVLEAVASRVPSAPLEELQLLWDKGQPYRAVSQAQLLARQAQERTLAAPFAREADHSSFNAQVALQLAQWMAETGQAAKDDIVELFDRAMALEPRSEAVLFRYALYLDEVMTDARRRQEVDRERGSRQKGLDRLGGMARIKLGEDKPFLEILPDVIRSYGLSMTHGHAHTSQSLPRMLTLWFDFGTFLHAFRGSGNKGQAQQHDEKQAVSKAATSILEVMQLLSKKVPMHTWLAALPQLISRMCHPCKEVSEMAKTIIVAITQAYPHQSLWSLAAVSKSGVAARRAAASQICNAAKKHLDHTMFAEMNSFCDQLIRLAAHQPSSGRTRVLSAKKEFAHLVRSMPLSNTVMPAMSCLTVALPPPPTLDSKGRGGSKDKDRGGGGGVVRPSQSELVTISAIGDQIEVMNSLQKPKKVTLTGSDGRHYTFLAKPKDDLRKDNRMMEAAGVVNRLFTGDPAARRRNLYLRRFAVLPIGEDNGIVEWVLHTTGLRHCLTDVYSAAGLFDSRTTNRAIQRIWEAAPPSKRRAEVLEEVLKSFPPLFHRWQLGRFTEPAAWLNARLAYTRTAAVWSMVGHVVGLGDRHGENILVDCCSGDVVHVDFSCLFDKGLTLQKPEMVPFRLTQNMIDGFGVSGVEGVYRRVCEITLSVLRQHKGSILSVMDTFVHDPLVDWTRGREGGSKAQGGDEGADNPHAKDALATIEGRLTGTLLGVSSRPCMPLSVEGQAHRLIEEASSKDNLGMMYIWWMPWM